MTRRATRSGSVPTRPARTCAPATSCARSMIRADGSSIRGIGIRRYAPSVPDMGAVTVGAGRHPRRERGDHRLGHDRPGHRVELQHRRQHRAQRSHRAQRNAGHDGDLRRQPHRRSTVSVNNNTERFNTAPVSGGLKVARSRGVVVRNSVLNDNYGPGLWFDESVYDITVSGNEMRNNAKHGLSLELSAKAAVSNNTISGNDGFGIKVNNTSSVTISNNTFVGNDRSINIVQDDRTPASDPGRDPRQPYPDPTMTWQNGPVSVTDNVMSNQQTGNCLLCVEDYSHQRSAEQMGVTANGNVYARPNISTPTQLVVWSTRRREPAGLQGPHELPRHDPAGSLRFRGRRHSDDDADHQGAGDDDPDHQGARDRRRPRPRRPRPRHRPPRRRTDDHRPPRRRRRPRPRPGAAGRSAGAVRVGRVRPQRRRTASAPPTSVARTPCRAPRPGYFVANGVGRIPGAVGANRSAYLPDVNERDIDFITDISLDTKPSGSGAYVSLIGRRTARGHRLPAQAALHARRLGRRRTSCARSTGPKRSSRWRPFPDLHVDPGEVVRARFVVEGGATTTCGRDGLEPRTAPDPSSGCMYDDREEPDGAPGPPAMSASCSTRRSRGPGARPPSRSTTSSCASTEPIRPRRTARVTSGAPLGGASLPFERGVDAEDLGRARLVRRPGCRPGWAARASRSPPTTCRANSTGAPYRGSRWKCTSGSCIIRQSTLSRTAPKCRRAAVSAWAIRPSRPPPRRGGTCERSSARWRDDSTSEPRTG